MILLVKFLFLVIYDTSLKEKLTPEVARRLQLYAKQNTPNETISYNF